MRGGVETGTPGRCIGGAMLGCTGRAILGGPMGDVRILGFWTAPGNCGAEKRWRWFEIGGTCDGGGPGGGADGSLNAVGTAGLNVGAWDPARGPDDEKGIVLAGAEVGGGLEATGPDDTKGLVAGGGAAAKGLAAGLPGKFG